MVCVVTFAGPASSIHILRTQQLAVLLRSCLFNKIIDIADRGEQVSL